MSEKNTQTVVFLFFCCGWWGKKTINNKRDLDWIVRKVKIDINIYKNSSIKIKLKLLHLLILK